MIFVRILIHLKQSVSDPQGETVKRSLSSLNYKDVENVRIGKSIELLLKRDCPEEEIKTVVTQMCEKFLVNTVIEDYEFEWKKLASS